MPPRLAPSSFIFVFVDLHVHWFVFERFHRDGDARKIPIFLFHYLCAHCWLVLTALQLIYTYIHFSLLTFFSLLVSRFMNSFHSKTQCREYSYVKCAYKVSTNAKANNRHVEDINAWIIHNSVMYLNWHRMLLRSFELLYLSGRYLIFPISKQQLYEKKAKCREKQQKTNTIDTERTEHKHIQQIDKHNEDSGTKSRKKARKVKMQKCVLHLDCLRRSLFDGLSCFSCSIEKTERITVVIYVMSWHWLQ